MSHNRATGISRCKVCRINYSLCICAEIKPTTIKSLISLVVHVHELKLTSNTAHFVQVMLPESSEIHFRGLVNQPFDASKITQRFGTPLFLYPHEDAVELDQSFAQKHPGPYHLIVPDGNWHQARRVRKREDAFKSVMAVKLPAGIESEYQLRRAPQPNWVSTYESVAHTLGLLEGVEVQDHLMQFFRSWVKRTMFNRTGYKKYSS